MSHLAPRTPIQLLAPLLLHGAFAAGPGASRSAAQDAHIMAPVDSIERWLVHEPLEILDERTSRGLEKERTSRVTLALADGQLMAVKWAPAAWRGEAFNNNPRYEVAAYEIQKLFLAEPDYVVPPTVLRGFPVAWHQQVDEDVRATFPGTKSVLVALQYWLFSVTGGEVWDEDRFARDTVYARHLADLNVLTYLIRHNDANEGNFLISRTPDNPRIFSVDNGLSFDSEASDRGTEWRRLRVDRLPAGTVGRLQRLTEEDLTRQLETVAQFRVRDDGQLVPMEVTENLARDRGVRQRDGVIQLGLTRGEIRGVWRRLQALLKDVEQGEVQTF